jgi:hypothetical protein
LAPLTVGTLSVECRAWSDTWFLRFCLPTLYAFRFTLFGFSCPNKHLAILIDRDTFRVDKLGFEVFERLVVEGKLALQGPIRNPAFALEQSAYLVNDLVKLHSLAHTFT